MQIEKISISRDNIAIWSQCKKLKPLPDDKILD